MSMIKCSECGKEISDKSKVCVHCGNPLKNTEQNNSVNIKKNKNKKRINKIILISVIFLIAIFVINGIFHAIKNQNTLNRLMGDKTNRTSDYWGLTINGVSINLPCSLDKLTNAGIKITASDTYYEKLMTTTNQTFSKYGAKGDGWAKEISLDLKTGSDLSKKGKNVTVSTIRYFVPAYSFSVPSELFPDKSSLLTSSQFSLKNNITIGSKSEEVISTFGNDYDKEMSTVSDGYNYGILIYKSDDGFLSISLENGFVQEIEIFTNSSINVKEDDDLDNIPQPNSSSTNSNNSFQKEETSKIEELTLQLNNLKKQQEKIERDFIEKEKEFYAKGGVDAVDEDECTKFVEYEGEFKTDFYRLNKEIGEIQTEIDKLNNN